MPHVGSVLEVPGLSNVVIRLTLVKLLWFILLLQFKLIRAHRKVHSVRVGAVELVRVMMRWRKLAKWRHGW